MSEFFEGFSGFLSVTAGSYYCASAAPPGMLASLNGILTGAVFGLGIQHLKNRVKQCGYFVLHNCR